MSFGAGTVTITPVFKAGSHSDIAKAANGSAAKYTTAFTAGVNTKLNKNLNKTLATYNATSAGARVGKTFNKGFATSFVSGHVLQTVLSPALSQAGLQSGGTIINGLSRGVTAGGGLLASAIGGVVAAGVAAVAVTAGTALVKGMQRSIDMQTASFRMQGMGISQAQTDGYMAYAKKSVLGTPFMFNEAANAMSLFAAQGVKLDESFSGAEASINALVTASALSGKTNLYELTDVFAKIQGAGKIDGRYLTQLQMNMVPALGALTKYFGKTNEEIREMASNGEISAAQFNEAIIKFGGSAAEMLGQTLPGRIGNLTAALGRLGQKVTDPFVNWASRDGGVIDNLTQKINGFATSLQKYKAPDWFKGADSAQVSFAELTRLQADGIPILDMLKERYGATSEEIQNMANSGQLDRQAMLDIISEGTNLGSVFTMLNDRIKTTTGIDFGSYFTRIGTAMAPVIDIVKNISESFMSFFHSALIDSGALEAFGSFLSTVLTVALEVLTRTIETLAAGFVKLWEFTAPVREVLASIAGVVGGAIVAGFNTFSSVVSTVAGFLSDLWSKSEPLRSTLASIARTVGGKLASGFDKVKAAIEPVVDFITKLAEKAQELVGGAFKKIGNLFGGLFGEEKVSVDADTSKAKKKVDAWKSNTNKTTASTSTDTDTKKANNKIATWKTNAGKVKATTTTDTSTAAASQKVTNWQTNTNSKTATTKTLTSTTNATSTVNQFVSNTNSRKATIKVGASKMGTTLSWTATAFGFITKLLNGAAGVTLAARGGVAGGAGNSPRLTMFGEAGAEALVPLERNTYWINRVADEMRGALGATPGAGNVYINGVGAGNAQIQRQANILLDTVARYATM